MTNPFREFFKSPDSVETVNNIPEQETDLVDINEPEDRKTGRIIKLSDDGWGFISSKEIKFTRIFFHWTSLKQNTLNFTQLKTGMQVEFTAREIADKGWRAIKIEVVQ